MISDKCTSLTFAFRSWFAVLECWKVLSIRYVPVLCSAVQTHAISCSHIVVHVHVYFPESDPQHWSCADDHRAGGWRVSFLHGRRLVRSTTEGKPQQKYITTQWPLILTGTCRKVILSIAEWRVDFAVEHSGEYVVDTGCPQYNNQRMSVSSTFQSISRHFNQMNP